MYGKLISTQFFYQLRFFYQLLNYNNLDYNQIKIFIKLEIIGEEKLYIYIYIYFFFKSKKISAIWCRHLVQPWLLSPTFII